MCRLFLRQGFALYPVGLDLSPSICICPGSHLLRWGLAGWPGATILLIFTFFSITGMSLWAWKKKANFIHSLATSQKANTVNTTQIKTTGLFQNQSPCAPWWSQLAASPSGVDGHHALFFVALKFYMSFLWVLVIQQI
jgi:hypothetical protein